MLQRFPAPLPSRGRWRMLVALLLAAAAPLAACQGGGDGATDPTRYQTTANAPVEQDLAPCATAPPLTPGPAGAADWPTYHRANDRHGVDSSSQSIRDLNPLWAVRL